MIEFSYPWLFILLPLPLLVRYLLPPHREARPAVRVPFIAALQRVTGRVGDGGAPILRRTRVQWIQLLLMWLAMVAGITK